MGSEHSRSIMRMRRNAGRKALLAALFLSAAHSVAASPDPQYLAAAVHAHDAGKVRLLLAQGADVRGPRPGETPLICDAARVGDLDILKQLLDAGAAVNATDLWGSTALMGAASHGQDAAALILMDHGANRDVVDRYGMTALDYAAASGYPELRRHIADRGVARSRARSMVRDKCPEFDTDPARTWILSTFALLDGMNDDRCLCLGGFNHDRPSEAAALLKNTWGIKIQADTLKILERLSSGADAKRYAALAKQINGFNLFQRLFLEAVLDDRTEHTLAAVRKGSGLGPNGILAWDLIRYEWICGKAGAAGYLDRDEAWRRMRDVACRLQASYTSWKECEDAYVVGRFYWNGDAEKQPRFEAMERFLLEPENSTSVWNTHPWDQDLGCGAGNGGPASGQAGDHGHD